MNIPRLSTLLACSLVSFASVAEAAPDAPEPPEAAPVQLDITGGTVAPLSIGGQLTLELPARFLVQLDAGWLPPAYGNAMGKATEAFTTPEIGRLVADALADSPVVRASGGWRPFPSAGFEVYGGYTYLALHGAASAADVAAITGAQVAADVELSSELHCFHVALGWRWVAADHLVIRAVVGYTQAVASKSSLFGDILDPLYDDYAKLPIVGLSAGYRL